MPRRTDRALLSAVGARLRAARIAKGWTQEAMAERVGCEPITISRLETGQRGLSLTTLFQLAAVLGAPLAVLLDIAEPPVALAREPDDGEAELLRVWRRLPADRRDLATRLLRELDR